MAVMPVAEIYAAEIESLQKSVVREQIWGWHWDEIFSIGRIFLIKRLQQWIVELCVTGTEGTPLHCLQLYSIEVSEKNIVWFTIYNVCYLLHLLTPFLLNLHREWKVLFFYNALEWIKRTKTIQYTGIIRWNK
jgi:hypothetical protein